MDFFKYFFDNSIVFDIIWPKRFDLIGFPDLSYLVPVKMLYLPGFLFSTDTKSSEKMEWSFLIRLSGVKSEFLRPKTLFMHLRPRLNSLEKKLFSLFIRGTKYGVFRHFLKCFRNIKD